MSAGYDYKPVMSAIDAGKHVYCEWPPDQLVVNGIGGGKNAEARLCRFQISGVHPATPVPHRPVDEAGPHAVRARAFATKAADSARFLAAEDYCRRRCGAK